MSQKATGQKPASAAKETYASKHLLSPMLFPDLGHQTRFPSGMENLSFVFIRRLETVSMGLQSEAAALLP
jgi:hypothetical protein